MTKVKQIFQLANLSPFGEIKSIVIFVNRGKFRHVVNLR